MKLTEYIDDVKRSLMDDWGMSKDDADFAVEKYGLKERINHCPMIVSYDEPKAIAEAIAKVDTPHG